MTLKLVLEYFACFGVEGFCDLRGMFAVIFYNVENGEIIAFKRSLGHQTFVLQLQ